MDPVARTPADYKVFRISPDDTNRLAIIFDPIGEEISFISCVEIYDVGGKTPPNMHTYANEMFFILKGEGLAHCGGTTLPIRAGDAFLAPAGQTHVVENTGESRLYALCTMVPNEGFAELIRRGTPESLDAEDLAVLQGNVSGPKTPLPAASPGLAGGGDWTRE
jgi:mannose-6-phosphate isomerase-like protein (cupin superfamily)